ncbi:MAG TPA: crotonase/enoyl-CoA hydratase family protein [Candidatus Angelobacter sp.]|jgi:enoyl-CoA hydratase|nr:crotonase/enoyl-CoA hydratase family protein [Candidatus Angelobacter sp.]
MNSNPSVRTETEGRVRSIILCRPERYNTINAQLRDEFSATMDAADADDEISVILLRADGPSFCAGYALDEYAEYAPQQPAGQGRTGRVWDSVFDLRNISAFVSAFAKLWYASKPTIAAVQGWCIAGGTDLVFWADMIVAAESASFGYPPARVWGVPTNPLWVQRLGLQRAKQYLFTGDEMPAQEAAKLGLVLEVCPDSQLQSRAMQLAQRIALVPANQLQLMKLFLNQQAENQGIGSSRLIGALFDGIARHTQEGLDFVTKAQAQGFRATVRERDAPFGDYGEGVKGKKV